LAGITIVENSDSAALSSVAREFDADLVLAGSNLGFGKACNLALRRLPDDGLALFLNPDALLSPGCLAGLEAAILSSGGPVLVNGWLMKQGRVQVDAFLTWRFSLSRLLRRRSYGRYLESRGGEKYVAVQKVSGGALAGRVSSLRALGPFDESFFLYGEDDDLSRRALRDGYKLLAVPSLLIQHSGGGSSSGASAIVERARVDGTLRVCLNHGGRLIVLLSALELSVVTAVGLLTMGSSSSRGARMARFSEIGRWLVSVGRATRFVP
jgi:GT2 family glycosyltransferase